MLFSMRRTVTSAAALLLAAGTVVVGTGALAGATEDAQLLGVVNQMRTTAGSPSLVTDPAATAAAGSVIGSLLTGGPAPTQAHVAALVGPSDAVSSVVLSGVDVLDAAEQAFSDAATAAVLTDRRFTLIGLASGYSATGDLVAIAVLRSPATTPEPVVTSPPAPEPVSTTAPPVPEPVVTTPPPAPEPVVTTPPAPAPSPVAAPTDRKDTRAVAKAGAKSERFEKFTGEKAAAKLDRLQRWLDRALAR